MVLKKILKVQSIADVCLLPNSSSGHCSHFLTIYVFRSKLSDKEPEGEKLNASCSENIHEHLGRLEGHDESCKLKKVTTHFHCFIFSNHPPTRVTLFFNIFGESLRRFAFNLEIISWHQFFCPRPFRRHAGLVQPNSPQPCNSGRKLIAQRLIGRTVSLQTKDMDSCPNKYSTVGPNPLEPSIHWVHNLIPSGP